MVNLDEPSQGIGSSRETPMLIHSLTDNQRFTKLILKMVEECWRFLK
jgi:hypothetical protein